MAGVGSTARVGEQDAMDEPGWAGEAEFQPPFDVVEPRVLAAPLISQFAHSGSRYPQRFLDAARLDPLTLRRSEDAFVDELFLPCVALGAPLLRAHFPRAFLDANREPFELDPQMFDGPLPNSPIRARCASRRAWARSRARHRRAAGGEEFLLDNFGDLSEQDVALLNARSIVRRHAQTDINNGFEFASGTPGEGGGVHAHFFGESDSLKHVRGNCRWWKWQWQRRWDPKASICRAKTRRKP